MWTLALLFWALSAFAAAITNASNKPLRQWSKRRIWIVVVWVYMYIATTLAAFTGPYTQSWHYISLGVGLLLLSTIPCGQEIFNKNSILRVIRILAFIITGLNLIMRAFI